MTTSNHTASAVLYLRMEPSWGQVDEIRQFVESFCASASAGPERKEQLALATHELVQNAIAHANSPHIELKLELNRETGRVEVSVSNMAGADQIAVLRSRLARTLSHANPLDGYVAAMREAPEERGGIGLARIRFEAALDLEIEVEGEKVTVHAAGLLAVPDVALVA